MSESEEEKFREENTTESPLQDDNHNFVKGNPLRFGAPGRLTPAEAGRKGHEGKGQAKRLTTYLRRLLDKPVSEFPALKKYHKLHGSKKAADFLMQRVFEEAAQNPHKAHPLVRDILNRIDGMLTPEIEVDPDTPVTVIKFAVVDKRAQVREENGDAAQV